jgi:hypothetical protein
MENINNEDTHVEITKICKYHQEERASGRWFINQSGLKKVSNVLGGDYSKLTSKQKKEFRSHCVNQAQDSFPHVKPWKWYLNFS